jgi:hypothetical protein
MTFTLNLGPGAWPGPFELLFILTKIVQHGAIKYV